MGGIKRRGRIEDPLHLFVGSLVFIVGTLSHMIEVNHLGSREIEERRG